MPERYAEEILYGLNRGAACRVSHPWPQTNPYYPVEIICERKKRGFFGNRIGEYLGPDPFQLIIAKISVNGKHFNDPGVTHSESKVGGCLAGNTHPLCINQLGP